ncbi:MAG: YbaB/EbfC family nucleoid-associated protein [Planctomycetota bacterium]
MNLLKIMKDLPDMLGRVREMQAKLRDLKVAGASGGGMVRAEVNGLGELLSITLEEEVVDPAEREMLQDLIVAAVSAARKKSAEAAQEEMQGIGHGLDLSQFGLPFPGPG